MMNKYVGLIFAAMAMEYYPRLSGVSDDNRTMSKYIGKQVEMMQLMLASVITLFIVLHPLMIRILYTTDFYVINGYLLLAIQGISFKAISWAIGFVLLAKGKGKLYLYTELASDVITLSLNILLYHYYGLAGVGASYTIGFIIYLAIIYGVCRHNYNIRPGKKAWIATFITTTISITTCICYVYLRPVAWILAVITTITAVIIIYRKWQNNDVN